MPLWEYQTVYLSGSLDFPDKVERAEALSWAGKSLSQQINTFASQGWEVFDMMWISDREVMVTFKRLAAEPDQTRKSEDGDPLTGSE
ncbi:MAG: hypothetical protein GXY36_04055 [Chloroflexi bacterium]|nr:hypothetical protein [Chloroflexota bacterium]